MKDINTKVMNSHPVVVRASNAQGNQTQDPQVATTPSACLHYPNFQGTHALSNKVKTKSKIKVQVQVEATSPFKLPNVPGLHSFPQEKPGEDRRSHATHELSCVCEADALPVQLLWISLKQETQISPRSFTQLQDACEASSFFHYLT